MRNTRLCKREETSASEIKYGSLDHHIFQFKTFWSCHIYILNPYCKFHDIKNYYNLNIITSFRMLIMITFSILSQIPNWNHADIIVNIVSFWYCYQILTPTFHPNYIDELEALVLDSPKSTRGDGKPGDSASRTTTQPETSSVVCNFTMFSFIHSLSCPLWNHASLTALL